MEENKNKRKFFISVVIPCLNEELGIGQCIKEAKLGLKQLKKGGTTKLLDGYMASYEILVIDNGSSDNSVRIAKKEGAKVIIENNKGYGFALRRGIKEANGEIIVMGDGDDSYDFSEIPKMVKKLNEGFDIVVGSRFRGQIKIGAMPFLHRYVGTPILNTLFNHFFKVQLSDTQSGFRAFKKEQISKLRFSTGGMEFASEMLYKTSRAGLIITEIPISYRLRKGVSKLSTIRDGWRHIKFMLLFSPSYLFVFPGTLLFLFGLILLIRLSFGPFYIGYRMLDVHTMIVSSFIVLLGFQIIFLGLYAKTYAFLFLKEKDPLYSKLLSFFTLEKGLIAGGFLLLAGLFLFGDIFLKWAGGGFGALSEIRFLILSITILILGVSTIFSSFFFALLGSGENYS